jgi:hypothetical protein
MGIGINRNVWHLIFFTVLFMSDTTSCDQNYAINGGCTRGFGPQPQ